MSVLGELVQSFEHGVEHEAGELLSAAKKWAEKEGMLIVKEVEAELKTAAPAEMVTLFNAYVSPVFGFALPLGAALGEEAKSLLATMLARAKATMVSGGALRASVLNSGIEQAVLLVKAALGDKSPVAGAPTMTTAPSQTTAN